MAGVSGGGLETRVVNLEAAQVALRDAFLGWQCRLRQLAVRQAGGRPTSGMRPEATPAGAAEPLGPITVLIHKADSGEATAQFRHMARKTNDPAERLQSALKHLQAAYYQKPRDFSDVMTALFGPGSESAARLAGAGGCRLVFEQYQQRYDIPCAVLRLVESEPAYQATYWHNALFNPRLPAGVEILAFSPDWAHASAEPPVG